MKVGKAEVDRRMQRFVRVCRDAGVKLTKQRIEIFRELARTADHPDAEAVHRGVRQRIPTVSLDTVYRGLWVLRDLGLILTLGPARERARFDANLNPHHHFVCDRCGATQDFYSQGLDALRLPELVGELGRVETTHVEARGICTACSRKKKRTRRKA